MAGLRAPRCLARRLLLFRSEDVEHEVLPSRAPRLAFTCWFYGKAAAEAGSGAAAASGGGAGGPATGGGAGAAAGGKGGLGSAASLVEHFGATAAAANAATAETGTAGAGASDKGVAASGAASPGSVAADANSSEGGAPTIFVSVVARDWRLGAGLRGASRVSERSGAAAQPRPADSRLSRVHHGIRTARAACNRNST